MDLMSEIMLYRLVPLFWS